MIAGPPDHRSRESRVGRTGLLLLSALGASGWVLLILRATDAIRSYAMAPLVDSVYLYDWRVHYAGALDLIERDLYLDGWIGVGTRRMPVDVFNLPPGAAAVATPPAALGFESGGLLWVVAGAIGLLTGAYWAVRVLRLPSGFAVVGLLLMAYAVQPFFVRVTALGNINSLMLPLLVAVVWAHLGNRQRTAGIALGIAVGLKIWPIALVVLVVRERRWLSLTWCAAVLAVQGALTLLWLGSDAVVPMIDALRTRVPIPTGVDVLWTSWARETLNWWPAWGSVAIAGFLVLIPARGRLGLGLGLLAGLSLIANIWDHYLPAFMLAWLLILSSAEVARMWSRLYRVLRGRIASPAGATSR